MKKREGKYHSDMISVQTQCPMKYIEVGQVVDSIINGSEHSNDRHNGNPSSSSKAKSAVSRRSPHAVEEVKPKPSATEKRTVVKKLLTAQDVAEMLGCSVKTIYSWAETGYSGIPTIKFGSGQKSLLRFDPDEIQEWVAGLKALNQSQYSIGSRYTDNAETVAKPRKGAWNKNGRI